MARTLGVITIGQAPRDDIAALQAIAAQAVKRKAGARGLRAIMEEVMLDVMYHVPYLPGIRECKITREVVEKKEEPVLVFAEEQKAG